MSLIIYLPNGQEKEVDPRDHDPKDQWTNRFLVPSSSSNVMHTVSQNKKNRHWGCSCNGWKRHKKCHHLKELGLPCFQMPYEPKLGSK
jgi:hypothetical protein